MEIVYKKDNIIFTHKLANDLLVDLSKYYSGEINKLSIDFSNAVQEGHYGGETAEDGLWTESCSGITVKDSEGEVVAEGWFDFIKDKNLGVRYYWVFIGGDKIQDKTDGRIPLDIWSRMCLETRKMYRNSKPNSIK